MNLSHHILQAINEFELNLSERIINQLFDKLSQEKLNQTNEVLLNDEELCQHLQISTSHFYKLKKKYRSIFPVYNVGKAKRYKLSEVETFFRSLSK
jgi:predicted DNA-binding transcriptional regulator AlpA